MVSNISKSNFLVSVIIPFKDRENLLIETLDSINRQTYKNLEVILVDDGSAKSFEHLISQKLSGYKCKYLKNEASKGPGYSRQKGFEQSSGDYVVYLDSDDILHPEMIEKCLAVMTEHPEYGMCYVASAEFNKTEELKNTEPLKIRKRSNRLFFENLILEMLTNRRVWDTSACFWRKKTINLFEPWINNFRMEDYAYDMQIQAKGVRVTNVPEVLCYYRKHSESLARSLKKDLPIQRLNMLIHTSNYAHQSPHIANNCKNEIQKTVARLIFKTYRDGVSERDGFAAVPSNPVIRFIINCQIIHSFFFTKLLIRFPLHEIFINGRRRHSKSDALKNYD